MQETLLRILALCVTGFKDRLETVSDEKINRIYKLGKLLSDLCWQEIKRRREK